MSQKHTRAGKILRIIYYICCFVSFFGLTYVYYILRRSHSISFREALYSSQSLNRILFFSITYVLLYRMFEIITGKNKKKTIFNTLSGVEIKRKGIFDSPGYSKDETLFILKERFDLLNEWRKRIGKKPLTKQEYMEMLQKEIRKNVIYAKLICGLAFGILIVFPVLKYRNIPIQYVVFLTVVVSIPFIMILYQAMKLQSQSEEYKAKLLEECIKRGITIIDYAEIKLEEQKNRRYGDITSKGE